MLYEVITEVDGNRDRFVDERYTRIAESKGEFRLDRIGSYNFV